MLPPGMASMYSPSTSLQSLLANMTAVPRPPQMQVKPTMHIGSPDLHSPSHLMSSPPTSPSSVTSQAGTTITKQSQHSPGLSLPPAIAPPTVADVPQSVVVMSHHSPQHQHCSKQSNDIRSSTPPEDRRSSSIAALRLKAREHELKLEMLRQNGHGDVLS